MPRPVAVEALKPLDLAVIVPTFKEADNVRRLIQSLERTLADITYEIIFVDDNSPDGTADIVRSIALTNARVRCLERLGRRGLAGASIEGIMATAAPVVVVIDGDMQHDERVIPRMLTTLQNDKVDVVVGSRYAAGGSLGNWASDRRQISQVATWLTQRVTGTTLSDPMSGFFMIRTATFRGLAKDLSALGFKTLLDIFASSKRALSFREIPYEFRAREFGESKLDSAVVLEFLELLVDKTIGRYGIPAKFVMFSLVGSLGVIVHLTVLTSFFKLGEANFQTAQIAAVATAMTFNFFLNNYFTHYDRRLRGWGLLKGWLSFCGASSLGAIANVGVAVYLYGSTNTVWFVSATAGILVGVVWNYAITSAFTWNRR